MMSSSKFEEFHVPFIKNLVFVALVTVVSMISIRYYLTNSLSASPQTPLYTSQESQYESK